MLLTNVNNNFKIFSNNKNSIVNIKTYSRKININNWCCIEITDNIENLLQLILNKENKIFFNLQYKEWLILKKNTLFNIKINNVEKKVLFCKIISFENVKKNFNNKDLQSENNNKLNYPEIPSVDVIYARCKKSMKFLDKLYRGYINNYNFQKNDIVAIKSVAGSGKTTTLLNLSKIHNDKKILYLAFNKSLINEINEKKHKQGIKNLYPKTFDSLMREIYIKINDIEPSIVDLKPHTISSLVPKLEKKSYSVKKFYIKNFNKFLLQSKYTTIEDFSQNEFNKKEIPLIEMWKLAQLNKLTTFDVIRKLTCDNHWCKDIVDATYDLIFIDEAQDFDNTMLNILLDDTTIPKLFVGDPKQAIYQWRGSINAFEKLPKNTLTIEFYSTFRIGNPACKEIKNKFKDLYMISKSTQDTTLEYNTPIEEKYVYLFRTWKSLLKTAQNMKSIYIPNFEKQISSIKYLHKKLQNSTLSDEELEDDDLPTFLKSLSKESLEELISQIEENITSEEESVCKMYTIHSFKGLEAGVIRIFNDINPKKEENLYYVALTRGCKRIVCDIEKPNIKKVKPIKGKIDLKYDKLFSDFKTEISNVNFNNKSKSAIESFSLFNEGKTIEVIANERNLTPETVCKHIIEFIPHPLITWDKFMSQDEYQKITTIIKILGIDTKTNILKKNLPMDLSFEKIKIVKTLMEFN